MRVKYISLLASMLMGLQLYGQNQPYINSIFPTRANVNETITISGSGFSNSTADLNVFFGAVKASVISSTVNALEVQVPPGATYDEIMVINLISGLSASSSQKFTLSYGGDTFDGEPESTVTSLFQDLTDISTDQNLVYDICMCDFDDDGLPDAVITAQEFPTSVVPRRLVYRNTSTPGTTSFVLDESLGSQPSSHVNCKDLDGDGKSDLVVTEYEPSSGARDVEVYRNTTVGNDISFGPVLLLELPRPNGVRQGARLELEDLNTDGKPDIIMSSFTNDTIDIYINESSVGTVAFNSSPILFNTSLPSNARGLKVVDLNQDNLPDLVVISFQQNEFKIFENLSTSNSILFGTGISFNTGLSSDNLRNVEVADFNGDMFPDLLITSGVSGTNGRVYSFENSTSTSGGAISFTNGTQFPVGRDPWGLSVGDLDGDGDVDAAIAMAGSDNVVEIMVNSSTGTDINFEVASLPVTFNSRNIQIGDINGDAKPDLMFTSNSRISTQGSLAFVNNRNCVTPVINPATDDYCPGVPFVISATEGAGLTYSWDVNGTVVNTGADNTLDISTNNVDVDVFVTTTTSDGTCVKNSATSTFNVNMVTTGNPSFTAPTSVCIGASLTLSSDVIVDEYFWTGPNDFSSNIKDPEITTTAENTGTYTLVVQQSNGCKSQPVSQFIEVISTPFPKVINTGPAEFCDGGSQVLSVNDFDGFGIQWNENGVEMTGENSTNITVTRTGNFSVTLFDETNTSCRDTSSALLIRELPPPVPSIAANSEICVGSALTLMGDTTSGNSSFPVSYDWDFLDGGNTSIGTASTQNTTFTFNTAGSYTARLQVAYTTVANCSGQLDQAITVSDPPQVTITTVPNTTSKCPEDSIRLEIPDNFTTYTWSTGDSVNFTFAKTSAGTNSVLVDVTATNSIGCTINESITISNFSDGGIIISSPDATVNNGVLTIPEGQPSIQLDASGGTNYNWSPGDIFDDSTSTSVNVFPKSAITEVILTGTDINSCAAMDTISLVNDNIVGRKSFSPNGDGLGFDCWEIINGASLSNCTVYVFDSRGRTLFQADSPFENDCAWDGIDEGGNQTPEGVYYYVLKCDDDQFSRSGSILLGR